MADLVRGSAALPLAFLEERRLGLPLRSWLLLEDRAPELELLELPSARREPALRALGPWLVRLHLRGIDHGDLKASHLFVDPEALDQGPALIDLESIAFRRRLRSAMRRLALVQLNASLPDDPGWSDELRRRVLRRYLLHEPLGGPEPEVVARIVRESLARRHRWRGRACTSAR